MQVKYISTPITEDVVKDLQVGDKVYISGVIYTARDAAHKRLVECIEKAYSLPFDLSGQIIFYTGPTPARPGRTIGSLGPTSSYRMDEFSPKLLRCGLKGIIGKGRIAQEVRESLVRYRAVYLGAVGGVAALLSRCVISSEVIAYSDLGPEAIRRLEVSNFSVVVINDIYGEDQYLKGRADFIVRETA